MEEIRVSKIQIKNFRNLSNEIIEFNPKVNCIFGKNGNGKTNILEAIYYLVHHKSFRKSTGFPQLLSMDCEEPEILFNSYLNNEKTYSGKLNTDGQSWHLDNKPSKGKLKTGAIFINPFDSFTFHSQSSFRRHWFDLHIGMYNPEFKKVLNKYQTALKFRNALLGKYGAFYDKQLEAIDEQIAEFSISLIALKEDFIETMNDLIEPTFKKIFEERHELKISLESKLSNLNKDQIKEVLRGNFNKDNAVGHTTIGVHRDDYMFNFDGMNSYEYCSLGQQKMSYLSLVFAYIDAFRSIFGVYPMVLIDDVSGELDSLRWKNLIEYLETKSFQVFITTANEAFERELLLQTHANRIHIENGYVN